MSQATPVARTLWRSKKRWPASCAGMRWRWWCGPTAPTANSGDISPAMRRRPIYLRSASIIFSVPVQAILVVTSSIFSRILHQVFMRVPISKAPWARRVLAIIGKRSAPSSKACKVCPPIHIRGSCPSSGNFPRGQWALVPSARFIRRVSCAISSIVPC